MRFHEIWRLDQDSNKPGFELVRQNTSPRIEPVLERISEQVGHPGGVDVRESKQPPGEVGGIVVAPKCRPEIRIEHPLQFEF